jgi:translation initiation factor SUI1
VSLSLQMLFKPSIFSTLLQIFIYQINTKKTIHKNTIMNSNKITISVLKRTNKKMTTSVYGFDKIYDLEKILSYWKHKLLHCTGSIEITEEYGEVLQLTGDHKKKIVDFLIANQICSHSDIVFKGI